MVIDEREVRAGKLAHLGRDPAVATGEDLEELEGPVGPLEQRSPVGRVALHINAEAEPDEGPLDDLTQAAQGSVSGESEVHFSSKPTT